jgi:O-antigen ligase/tetratricopeptide (TPR) repeat protein
MSVERSVASGERSQVFSLTTRHTPLDFFTLAMMEVVLLALICLSPWAYGAVNPGQEFLLDAGIAVLLVLWAVRMLLQGQITWKKSIVANCLAGLFLLGIWQATPLPRSALTWLSPGAAHCYDQFLPQQPEIPADPLTGETVARPVSSTEVAPLGSTLSLYPGATERETTRLLAVFLVFVVVLNNLTSKEALIRLSWVAVLNGSLLSLFALIQFFAAPRYSVYWTISAQATPFGPFVCHNHFPDYVNMCIGLGIGLLLSQGRRGDASASEEQDASPLQMLRNPRTLWICGALGLMLTAVAFSCSRGGLLALVGAAVICGVLGRVRLGLSYRLGSILVVGGIVAALSAWFGIDLVKDRLATLGTGGAYESRLPLWLRSLPIAHQFPIWGTGYGTFGYIEPMYRKDAPSWEGLWPAEYGHAHNDYLEILVEGGVIGLGLAVLALAAVYRLGLRALPIHRGSRRAGLALGALFGFTALALHSFGEFGAHIPAITLLATVIAAHLCALGQSKPQQARSASDSLRNGKEVDRSAYRLRLGGVAPVLGALVAVGLGLVICADSWKAYRIHRLEDAATRADNDNKADQLRTRIACLTEAVSLGPENAPLHQELGLAHGQLAELLLKGDSAESSPKNLIELLLRVHSPEGRAAREHGILALQEYLHARDACPLLNGAQVGIARWSILLKQGDKAQDYFYRAKILGPGQVETWYQCGLREFTLRPPLYQDALASWRHCLELSDRYLPEILRQMERFPANVLLDQVLPDNPEVLLKAALGRYPEVGSTERRRPFLEKALRLLDAKEEELGPQDLLVKARIYKALEQPEQAIAAYRDCLNRNPAQLPVRYEFANYLCDLHKLEEARHELTVIVAQDPKNGAAKDLLDAVVHEMLQGKTQERKRQREEWIRRRSR